MPRKDISLLSKSRYFLISWYLTMHHRAALCAPYGTGGSICASPCGQWTNPMTRMQRSGSRSEMRNAIIHTRKRAPKKMVRIARIRALVRIHSSSRAERCGGRGFIGEIKEEIKRKMIRISEKKHTLIFLKIYVYLLKNIRLSFCG